MRDEHCAARDSLKSEPWYKRMEVYPGRRKGVEHPVQVPKNPFLMALVALVLCSCGGDSVTRGSSPGGDTAERTSAEGGETAVEPAPARTVAEPELRDSQARNSTPTRAAFGTNGMVSSAHPLATRAGLEVLKDGATPSMRRSRSRPSRRRQPYMSGIGGYGAMVVYDAGRRRCGR